MAAGTMREEGPDPSTIVVGLILFIVLILGVAGAANAVDPAFGAHAWMFAGAAALGLVALLAWQEGKEPTAKR